MSDPQITDDGGQIFSLVEALAQWCVNRAMKGDVSTDVLLNSIVVLVRRAIELKAH